MLLVFVVLTTCSRRIVRAGGASDGHESASTRLAWPSVATRNGLAPARTNRRAEDVELFRRLLSVSGFATHAQSWSNASRLVFMQIPQQPVSQINLLPAFSYFHQPN